MPTLVAKSMTPELSDFDIRNGCHSISFLSFERAIKESLEMNGIKTKPKGYRITEHGIDIIMD